LISSPANGAFVTATPTLTWQASSNAASYTLTITPTTGAPFVKAGLTLSTFTIPAASPLTEAAGPYTWRVTARDAAGATTDSNSWSFFVDTTPPLAFDLVAPSDGTFSRSAGRLRWDAATDAGSGLSIYHVYVDGVSCGDTQVAGFTLSAGNCDLREGPHTWAVSAEDATGNIRWCNQAPGGKGGWVVKIDNTGPSAGDGGTFGLTSPDANAVISQQSPTFSWQAATDQGAGGVTYLLYIDGLPSGTSGQATGTVITDTSYMIPDLLSDGPHTWRVRARDAVGNATDSPTRTVTVDTTKPDLFGLSVPNNGACSMTPTPNLCWFTANDLGGVGGYQLWIDGALTSSTTGPTTACAGAVNPSQEICNNLDDDCDGVIDQGTNGCGGVCTLPNDVSAPCDGDDADLCKEGVFMCDGLNSVKCVETAPVNVEVCNGRDDDCNGIVDDAPGCPHPDAGAGADADPSFDGGDDGGGDDAPIADDAGVAGTGGKTGRQPQDAGTDVAHARSGSGCSCAAAPLDREAAPLVGLGLALALAVLARARARR
jgi:hypothetical protein